MRLHRLTIFFTIMISLLFLKTPNFIHAATTDSSTAGGRRWVMAVGICKFSDTRIPQLAYCGADARTIADYFKENHVPAERIILLINEDADKNSITNALHNIANAIAPNDSLFFFYSSHGAGDESGTTYFITFDTVGDNLAATALPMQELKTKIKAIKCRNIVMMIDTCHSGGVKSLGLQNDKAYDKLVRTASKQTRIAILTSSRTHESSLESPEWKHGAFTYYMLDGLTGTADNFPRDGRVSVTELFDYVMIAVPRATKRAQHPSAKFSYNWPGEKEQAVQVGTIMTHFEDKPDAGNSETGNRIPGQSAPSPFTVISGSGRDDTGRTSGDNGKNLEREWQKVVE